MDSSPRAVQRHPVRARPRRRTRPATALLLLAVAAAVGSATTSAQVAQYRFEVLLDSVRVGHHRVRVETQGDQVRVSTEARFDVKVLSVPVFHYVHRAIERWQDGCLQSLVATTDDNGRPRKVEAASDGEALRVVSGRGEERLPGCVHSYAYWNPDALTGSRLLNAQTGEYQAVRVTSLPEESITLRGAAVPARHYRIDTGRHEIDVWYSREGRWIGLESVIALGRRLRYRPE